MGDNINIDWSRQNPNAFIDGFKNAQTMQDDTLARNARDAVMANPNDANALSKYAMFDPAGAQAVQGQLDVQRAALARTAGADAYRTYQPINQFTPQPATQATVAPAPGQAPIVGAPVAAQPGAAPVGAPVAPVAPVAGGAPAGVPGVAPMAGAAPAPGAAPAAGQPAQPAGPLTNPLHPDAIAMGQAAMQGQMTQQEALARVAQQDPTMAAQLVTQFSNMDIQARARAADSAQSLGAAAQTLLSVPQAQRAAELQKMAPQLAQHGIGPQQLQQAMQEGLSDNFLKGIAGQAVGTQAIIAHTDTVVDQTQKQQEIGIQQGHLNETIRQDTFEQGKGVQDGFGNIVNPTTGKVIYKQGGNAPGGAFSANAPQYAAAFKAIGIPENATAGFIGNFHIESGFNPGAVGDNGLAVGVAQLHPDRAAAFTKMFGVSPAQGTPEQVAQFTKTEIDSLPAQQRAAIMNASSPGAAAAAIDQYYERSNGQTRDQRVDAANTWAQSGGTGASGGGGMDGATIHDQAQAALDSGSLTPLPGTARNKAAQVAIANEITRIKTSRGLSDGDILSGKAALHADTGSLAKLEAQATLVRSAEAAATRNGDLASSLAPAVGNGNIQVFNAWKNHWNTSMGDPAVAKFATSVSTFANEYAAVMGRGTSTDTLRAEAVRNINTAQSPDQFSGVVAVMKQDMANRRAGYDQERADTMGRIKGGYNQPNSGPAVASSGSNVDDILRKHGVIK